MALSLITWDHASKPCYTCLVYADSWPGTRWKSRAGASKNTFLQSLYKCSPTLRKQTVVFCFYTATLSCAPLLLSSWCVTLADSSLDTLLSLGWIHLPIQAVINSEKSLTLQSPSASVWSHWYWCRHSWDPHQWKWCIWPFHAGSSGVRIIPTPKLACRLSSSLLHGGLIFRDLPTAENRDIQTRRRTHQRTSQFICLSSLLRL